MCAGPEVLALLSTAAEAAPEAAAAAGTAGAASAIPGMVAPGMAGSAALDSALINAGMPQLAGGALTKAGGLLAGNTLGGTLSGLSGGKAGSALATQMGMGLLQPKEQPMPQGGRPAPQGPQGPLANPYSSGMNSMSGNLPPPGMSYEEWMRRKQMMGGQGV